MLKLAKMKSKSVFAAICLSGIMMGAFRFDNLWKIQLYFTLGALIYSQTVNK